MKKDDVYATMPDAQYFAFYDTKVKLYRNPMLANSEWEIIRDYQSLCQNPKAGELPDIITNAEDFQLFRIGTYSRVTGQITPCIPEHVVNLHELKSTYLADLSRAKAPTLSELREATQQ